jgi:threonine aldolase
MPSAIIKGLLEQGFYFYSDRWGKNIVRLVTSFATQATDVDHFIAATQALAKAG